MSKVAPHNATIEYRNDGTRPYVYKKYRAKYTAVEESEAYERVRTLTSGIERVRPARVYTVDPADDSLKLEFVPGRSLWEIVADGEVGALERVRADVMTLTGAARARGVRFDCDPSNLMCESGEDGLVIIDPVCVDLELRDFAMVVFLWGLLKLVLRNPRVWRDRAILRSWFRYYREYLERAGTAHEAFNEQMVRYIDVAIGWNKEKNPIEGPLTRGFRFVVVVPLYRLVRAAFRRNLVRP